MKKLIILAAAAAGCVATTEDVTALKREVGILKTRVARSEKETEKLSRQLVQQAVAIRTQGRKLDVVASRPAPQPKIVYMQVPEKKENHLPVAPDPPRGDEEKRLGQKLAYDKFTELVQEALRKAGYEPGRSDGRNGRKTTLALKEFQRASGLAPTGMADPKTWEELQKYR